MTPAALEPVPSVPPREIDGPTLILAQRGERWARRVFVETYQGRVHALAWRMLVAPGRHRVRFIWPDGRDETLLVKVEAGETKVVKNR